ncbi:coiled-coil domain-containing protein 181 isoform X1 [Hyperolius riggenbachi]|uniref:coiled-coil domain-containing protein 181 isoform X1 n=1 Tax=Hyperolius riggenbachi TaxID=752182 RepID=UPI0035A2E490
MSEKEESDSEGGLEYEDDFEKDLDWLINEEEKQHASSLNENSNVPLMEQKPNNAVQENRGYNIQNTGSDKTAQDFTDIKPNLLLDAVPESDEVDPEEEEAKRYVAEKIEEANKKLEMETIDENRQRRLKFKDNLIDLEIPPPEFPDSDRPESIPEDAVDSINKLNLNDVPAKQEMNPTENEITEEHKDGKVLVEKDGKFELVNLKDIENQCSLPPISNKELRLGILANGDDVDHKNKSTVNNRNNVIPQPPTGPKVRPSSATHLAKSIHKVKPSRRAQSAGVSTRNSTFSLSHEQKELQKRIQERQERLRREEEERKKEEEEHKQRENEVAFKAWLQKKNEQHMQEKRIQQAKELETSSTPDKDSQDAYALWLRRKHRDHVKEKKLEELKNLETASFLEERKNREGAFAQWLKQKRIQKQIEQQVAKERSRRLLLEARRRKQIHNLLYNVSDSKSFCYVDPYS